MLEDLADIGFTPITDVLSVVDGKVILKDSSEWPEGASQAVESVRESKDGVSLKMVNKLDALGKLGNHLGLFSDLNVALNTLRTYGQVTKTEDGYKVVLETSKNN